MTITDDITTYEDDEYIDITDMVEMVDDWEDVPTSVEVKAKKSSKSSSTMLPPAKNVTIDEEDVFLLTDKRNNQVSFDELIRNDHVSIEIPKLAPPPDPADFEAPRVDMSSLAPMAISDEQEDKAQDNTVKRSAVKRPGKSSRWLAATTMTLAAAAVTIAFWPTHTPQSQAAAATQPEQPPAVMVDQPPHMSAAILPHVVNLQPVHIVATSPWGHKPRTAPAVVRSKNPLEVASPAHAAATTLPSEALADLSAPASADDKVASPASQPQAVQPDVPTETTPKPAAGPFDRSAAVAALRQGAARARACEHTGASGAVANISVTFAPTGRVTTAVVQGPRFSGTPLGSCVARAFRGTHIPAFTGPFVTVHKRVHF